MSYLEGIGDEVLISVAIVAIILISLLLWSIAESSVQVNTIGSTLTEERVQESSTSGSQSYDAPPPEDQGRPQLSSDEPLAPSHTVSDDQSTTTSTTTTSQNQLNSDKECEESPEDIRQRRLEFFSQSGSEGVDETKQNCDNTIVNGSVSTLHDDAQTTTEVTSGLINIRLKYLDDTERTVLSCPSQKIQDFKRAHFADDLANNRLVRLISTGYVLEDTRTLESYGLMNNSVVHVLVQQTNQTISARPSSETEGELDLGQFLSPILGVALLCVWIMHFQYKEYFTTTATVALLVLSCLFLTLVWSQHSSRTPNMSTQ